MPPPGLLSLLPAVQVEAISKTAMAQMSGIIAHIHMIQVQITDLKAMVNAQCSSLPGPGSSPVKALASTVSHQLVASDSEDEVSQLGQDLSSYEAESPWPKRTRASVLALPSSD